MLAITILFVARLGHLQILQRGVYDALASGQRELYRELFPERGDILVTDQDGTEVPLATNQFLNLVWAEPRRVDDPIRTAQVLSEILEREVSESENAPTPPSVADAPSTSPPAGEDATGNLPSPLACTTTSSPSSKNRTTHMSPFDGR